MRMLWISQSNGHHQWSSSKNPQPVGRQCLAISFKQKVESWTLTLWTLTLPPVPRLLMPHPPALPRVKPAAVRASVSMHSEGQRVPSYDTSTLAPLTDCDGSPWHGPGHGGDIVSDQFLAWVLDSFGDLWGDDWRNSPMYGWNPGKFLDVPSGQSTLAHEFCKLIWAHHEWNSWKRLEHNECLALTARTGFWKLAYHRRKDEKIFCSTPVASKP